MTIFQWHSGLWKACWNRGEHCLASLSFIVLTTFVKIAQGFEGLTQMHCNSIAPPALFFKPKLDSHANMLSKKFSKGYLIPRFPLGRAGLSPLTRPTSGSYSLCTSWTTVLFPQPLFPTRAAVCPLSTLRLRPFKIFKGKREKQYTSHQEPEGEVIWLNFTFGKIVLNKGI